MKLLTKKRLTSNPKRLNSKKLKLAILTLLVFPFQISNATAVTPICATTFTVVQEIIKGKVLDEKGNSLSGVNVSVKGSNEKTQTGFDGSFTIQTPNNNSVLVFSYLGMETREIIASFSPMSIVLRENTKLLDDVVMVGYTSQKSNKISGAVATIKAAKLRDVTEGDVGKMLQGKISGVTVTNNSGDPGEQPIIRIRGIGSITAGSNPLYVVDGVIGGIPNRIKGCCIDNTIWCSCRKWSYSYNHQAWKIRKNYFRFQNDFWNKSVRQW